MLSGRALVVVAGVALFGGVAPQPVLAQAVAQPRDPYFDFLMARRLESEGNNPAALAALERAAAGDPTSAEVKAEIAAFHLRRNQRPEAEKAARAALALDEKNVEANRSLGLILSAVVDSANERTPSLLTATAVKDAIMHLERVLTGSIAPDAGVQDTLGRLYIRNGDTDKAIQILTRALGQNPNSVRSRLTLAQAHATAQDLPSAIGVLEEIVEEEPRVASALGQYQEQARRWTDAARSYTIALAVLPTNADIKVRRIVALQTAKEYAAAAGFAADARKQHPQDLRFPQLQAGALFEAGDKTGAIAVLEATVKAVPTNNQIQFALVDLYQDAGRSADAERVLRQILVNEPANVNALNTLGYLLAVRGDQLDEAIRLVRRALDKDPDRGEYLDSLGWAYFRKGDMDEAEKYLLAAAARLPDNAEVQDHLGDLHARRGRWQEAITAWTRALGTDQAIDRPAVERKLADARSKIRR
jgi:tetratricopeptide (TPR) repeat protein